MSHGASLKPASPSASPLAICMQALQAQNAILEVESVLGVG